MLSDQDLGLLDRIWHRFGAHRPPSRPAGKENRRALSFAPGLGPRADAARNFLRTGGRLGRTGESPALLKARTSYFREEYAYGDDLVAPGIDSFMANEQLREAAKAVFGMPLVIPFVAYGNLLVPGQELGLHTDVPAFRGADRNVLPLWLLVAMRHSGLFERWRIPIATAVSFVGESPGGEFACYPQGADGPVTELRPEPGTVVILDADTVFHGVDRVGGDDSGVRSATTGKLRLTLGAGRTWQLSTGGPGDPPSHFRYGSDELRFSVSWKSYCFSDEEDLDRWRSHSDDLAIHTVRKTFEDELTRLGTAVRELSDTELAVAVIDTFVRFPESSAAGLPR